MSAAPFTFNGVSTVIPQVLCREEVAAQNAAALLPFGTVFMAGAADGGVGGGTIYRGTLDQLKLVLRGGELYNDLQKAVGVGPTNSIIAVVCGTKKSADHIFATGAAQPFAITTTGSTTTSDGIVWTIQKNGGTVPVTATVTATAAESAANIAAAVLASIQGKITDGTLPGWTVTLTAPATLNFIAPEAADTVTFNPSQSTHILVNAANTTTGPLAVPVENADLVAGDQGSWTNQISFSSVVGTTSGFAYTISWPDANGNINRIGGKGTAFDNLPDFAALRAAILANAVLTPPVSSGLPAVVVLTVLNNVSLTAIGSTNLTGGSGDGSATLVFADYKPGIDAMINESYDVGHLAGCTDPTTQAYLDAQTRNVVVYGRLRRNIHQQVANGLSPTASKATNSAALTAFAVAAAAVLDFERSILCVQALYIPDPNTGAYGYFAAAPYYLGRLVLDATTGDCGPATPSTNKPIPGAADVDYAILPGGDLEEAVGAGVTVFQRPGDIVAGGVRVVRSVSTAPVNPNNNQPWPFFEVSALRSADAVLASMKATVEFEIGEGATVPVLAHIVGAAKDVLSNALQANWITSYDDNVQLVPGGGSGTGYILSYSCAPTLPLNNVGIDELILPFQASIAAGGTVNG